MKKYKYILFKSVEQNDIPLYNQFIGIFDSIDQVKDYIKHNPNFVYEVYDMDVQPLFKGYYLDGKIFFQ